MCGPPTYVFASLIRGQMFERGKAQKSPAPEGLQRPNVEKSSTRVGERPKEFKERIENIEYAPKNKPGVALVTTYTEPLRADVSALEKTIKRKMLGDQEVRDAYDALADEFDLARELIAARVRAGLTQAELAERMGTSQSVIARLSRVNYFAGKSNCRGSAGSKAGRRCPV
jgi:ribosome-binding protein aMBF1 (putative translation factor)